MRRPSPPMSGAKRSARPTTVRRSRTGTCTCSSGAIQRAIWSTARSPGHAARSPCSDAIAPASRMASRAPSSSPSRVGTRPPIAGQPPRGDPGVNQVLSARPSAMLIPKVTRQRVLGQGAWMAVAVIAASPRQRAPVSSRPATSEPTSVPTMSGAAPEVVRVAITNAPQPRPSWRAPPAARRSAPRWWPRPFADCRKPPRTGSRANW